MDSLRLFRLVQKNVCQDDVTMLPRVFFNVEGGGGEGTKNNIDWCGPYQRPKFESYIYNIFEKIGVSRFIQNIVWRPSWMT